MNRRAFLKGGSSFLTVVASGCIELDNEVPGVILTRVELGNASGEKVQFDLLVKHDGEIIHWSTHDVGTGQTEGESGGKIVDIDSPDELGNVEVYVRAGEVWNSIDFDDERFANSYVIAVVTYGKFEDGFLRISRIRSGQAPKTRGGNHTR